MHDLTHPTALLRLAAFPAPIVLDNATVTPDP
jgi:hypothetical protein